MAKKSVTAADVAKLAGVSQPTLSRVYDVETKLPKILQLKVKTAAAEFGYRPNKLARTLATGSVLVYMRHINRRFSTMLIRALTQTPMMDKITTPTKSRSKS